MASGSGLGITTAIYAGVGIVVLLLFSIWRSTKATRKFYAPKR